MTILFLCGSLSPGRDGVGDYTRRLAGELIRQGHQASIVALNDRLIDTVEQCTQEADGTPITVLRMPANLKSKQRFALAGEFITAQNPEWLSLQYVPFSFQEKGLPFGLGRQLAKLGKGRKWHVMFHELWVGMDDEASLKFKLWGRVQRHIIHTLLKKIKPKQIDTQTSLYQFFLQKMGYNADLLPLFGNVPVLMGLTEKPVKEKDSLSIVFFGSIHPGAPVADFLDELLVYAETTQKKLQVLFVGRCGAYAEPWIGACNRRNIPVISRGEQSLAEISAVLSDSDLGLSTTPYLLSQKSGTVSAMLEHQLPVISVSRAWVVSLFQADLCLDGIVPYEKNKLASVLGGIKPPKSHHSVHAVTSQLLSQLVNR